MRAYPNTEPTMCPRCHTTDWAMAKPSTTESRDRSLLVMVIACTALGSAILMIMLVLIGHWR
jgi:hypothetical protein